MFEKGCVVKSIAGHDRDRFYMIVAARRDRVWIADGKARKLEKPKAKNPAHVRPTKTILDPDVVKTDKKLREALAPFQEALRSGQEGGN